MESNWKGYAYTASLTALLCYGSWMAGCANTLKPTPDAGPHIDHAVTGVKAIPPLMDDAIVQTKAIEKKITPKDIPLIAPHTEAIRQDATEAKQKAVTATADLKMATDASDRLKAACGELQDQNAKLTTDLSEAKSNQMKGLIALSVLAIGAGVGLLAYGLKAIGVAVAIGGGAALYASIMVAHAAGLLAVGTGVLVLAAIAYMGWKLFVEKKATTELVQTGEAVKAYLTAQQRAAIFGIGGVPGQADLIQSDSTQALVEHARGVAGTPGSVRITPQVTPATATVTPARPAA